MDCRIALLQHHHHYHPCSREAGIGMALFSSSSSDVMVKKFVGCCSAAPAACSSATRDCSYRGRFCTPEMSHRCRCSQGSQGAVHSLYRPHRSRNSSRRREVEFLTLATGLGREAFGSQWQHHPQRTEAKTKRGVRRGAGGGGLLVFVAAKAGAPAPASDQRNAAAEDFSLWLKDQGFPEQAVAMKAFGGEGLGLAALRPLKAGEFALTVPENFCVTAFDVTSHPVISSAASGRGDLVGLTLWLMYERGQGKASSWYKFLQLFPETTLSPLLWTDAELDEELRGSSVLEETRRQLEALEGEYEELKTSYFDQDPKAFPPETFSFSSFKNAFAVITSRAQYLPSADIFALVPYGDCVNHRAAVRAYLDYSTSDQAVVLKVDRDYKAGQQVFVNYGPDRPNSDLLISYGFVDNANTNNFLETEVDLLPADRLRVLKQQILEQAGFGTPQTFPLFEDRFPTQLLTYVRLSRLTDVGLFAKIVFDRDIIIDDGNEYEILMLLMGDCRVRLQEYSGNTDDETRIANDQSASPKEKVAAQLRLSEKKVLINTMGALRNRLAPIRGIPTKGGGMKDPNSDLLEMFDMAEQVATAPIKFISNLFNKK